MQSERNYHLLTLQFPVNDDCPLVVAAVAYNDNDAVAIVDNDDFDRPRSYKYVRVSLWTFLLHYLIGICVLNYAMGMIVLDDYEMNFVHKSFVYVTVIVVVVNMLMELYLLSCIKSIQFEKSKRIDRSLICANVKKRVEFVLFHCIALTTDKLNPVISRFNTFNNI